MTDQQIVNFLEEREGLVSEIKLSLLIELVRMVERNGLQGPVDKWIAASDPTVIVSIKTANELKQFVLDHKLHEKEHIGKVVALSATCGCDGKGPGGG